MMELYERAIQAAGYDLPPTEESVRECFADYVAAGYFADLDMDDLAEIKTEDMAIALIRG